MNQPEAMKNNKIQEAILHSLGEAKKSQKEYFLNHIYVYIVNDMEASEPDKEGVSVPEVLENIKNLVPGHLMQEIDSIYIGTFDIFESRDINAMYDAGAIYVSNIQSSAKDMVDDIIHEFAHSLEEKHGGLIYSDGKLSREFLGKRRKLFFTMLNYPEFEGVDKYMRHFLKELEFNEELDVYLAKEIGYPTILNLTKEYLNTPYAITSLSEYFSTGFEDYFVDMKLREYLGKVSPALYKILNTLEIGEYDGH